MLFLKSLVLILDVVMLCLWGKLTVLHKKNGDKNWWIDLIFTVLLVGSILYEILTF